MGGLFQHCAQMRQIERELELFGGIVNPFFGEGGIPNEFSLRWEKLYEFACLAPEPDLDTLARKAVEGAE